MTASRVIFTHIPKTAGSTLLTILIREYGDTLFRFYEIYAPNKTLFNQLTEQAACQPERIRAVSGHVPYGIHAHLGGQWQYFTVLRDPVKRLISNYYHILADTHHFNYDRVKGLTLEQYAQTMPAVGELQTRYLLGMPQDEPEKVFMPRAPLPADALEQAKQRLTDDYAAFGVMERFDESMLLLQKAFGWRSVRYHSRNVAVNKPKTYSPETMAVIHAACTLDQALYDYAKQLFEQRLEQAFGASLADKLDAYRRKNALYQRTRDLKQTVYGVLRRFKK